MLTVHTVGSLRRCAHRVLAVCSWLLARSRIVVLSLFD